MRNALLSSPVLAYPNFKERFTLYTDASNTGLGAVLSQNINGVEKTIAFASRSLKGHERKYATIERECLALVWGIKYFRTYLYGKMFDIITDHNPLKWLDNARDPHFRFFRWSLTLQSYTFNIKHRSGKQHGNADALSRMPHPDEPPTIETNAYAIESPGLQLDGVRELQKQDPNLQDLIDYFDKGSMPEDSTGARRLMATIDNYVYEEGILYHLDSAKVRCRVNLSKQLVIPWALKEEVMLSLHEEITSGHLSFEKTYL